MKRAMISIGITLALASGLTLLLLWLLGGSSVPATAAPDVITVCLGGGCDHTGIQAAVDAANSGDVIKVASGVYTGVSTRAGWTQAVYISKSVTVRGGYTTTDGFADPPDPVANPTTLDALGQGRVVYIRGSGDITPTLAGLRLTNGAINNLGGGIYAYRAHPTISGCHVYSNTATNGGGIFFWRSDKAALMGNRVYYNTASAGNGGGIFFWGSGSATMINSMVVENLVSNTLGTGAGINVYSSTVRLLHTTLARNRGGAGHGLYIVGGSAITAINTILVSHTVGINVGGGAIPSSATLTATLWGTGTWANETDWFVGGTLYAGTLNIRDLPAFLDPLGGDYHIGSGSAAIDAGVDARVTTDIDRDPRPIGLPDLGADEWGTRVYLPLVLREFP